MNLTLERVREAWTKAGSPGRPGLAEEDVQRFERRLGVRIPDDMRSYLLFMDGMSEGECDEQGIRFWPLSEVKPALEELPEGDARLLSNYFVFADYSLWTHGYAVRLTIGRSDVVIVGGAVPIQVSSSFAEFLRTYVETPERLFGQQSSWS